MADDANGQQRGSFRHYLTLKDGTEVPISKETFRRLLVAKKLGSEFTVGESHGEAWGKLCRSLWPELVEESELRKLAGEPLSDRKLMERWRSWTDRPIPGTHSDWKHLAHWVGIEVPKDITDEWIEGDLLPALTAKKQREAEQVAAATRQKQATEAAADAGKALDSKGGSCKAKSGKKRGRKPASDDEIEDACEVRIEYQQKGMGKEAFCVWRNGDKKVGRVGVKWLNAKLALVQKLLRESPDRIPKRFANKLKPLRRVKRAV